MALNEENFRESLIVPDEDYFRESLIVQDEEYFRQALKVPELDDARTRVSIALKAASSFHQKQVVYGTYQPVSKQTLSGEKTKQTDVGC